MIPLAPFLHPCRTVDLRAATKRDALVEICRVLEGCADVADPSAFEAAILAREEVMSTGIGLGIAVPHAKIPSVKEFVVALGRSKAGIEFHSLDGKPVHLVVLIAGPDNLQSRYLGILAGVTLRLKREEVRRALLAVPDPKDMIGILAGA
jgi:mannitol/fructose-specific phosphotransferase system IIA component (Ntr-type)